jgi:hypothetical protein
MANETSYLLVVHGTWNPPSADDPLWHQAGSKDAANFCNRLETELAKRGTTGSVWRQWNAEPAEFGWTGANEHEDRIRAGDDLFSRWLAISKVDPTARINIVAHSHGCNVTLRAVQKYLEHLDAQAELILQEATSLCSLRDDGYFPEAAMAAAQAIATATGMGSGEAAVRFQKATLALQGILEQAVAKQEAKFNVIFGGLSKVLNAPIAPARQLQIKSFAKAAGPFKAITLDAQQRKRFKDIWITSRESNRLGKQVFLGAPFFSKLWPEAKWWQLPHVLRQGINYLAILLAAIAVSYLTVLLFWGLLWLALSPLTWLSGSGAFYSPTFNPLKWHLVVQILAGIYLLIFAIGFSEDVLRPKRRSVNPYFDYREPHDKTLSSEEYVVPLKTLVVTGELLDEVILGFSAEPLVNGELRPQLKKLVSGKSIFERPRFTIGQAPDPSDWVALSLRTVVGTVVSLVLALARPFSWIWEHYISFKIWQLLSSAAFGLGPREFVGSLVAVDHELREPSYFDQHVWVVTEQLFEHPIAREIDSEARKARYKFLWNDEELERRVSSSWLWRQRDRWKKEIDARYAKFPELRTVTFDSQLKRTCLVLEERFKEMVGLVELSHSSYYSNSGIITAIAEFITSGTAPPNAKRAGEVPSAPVALPPGLTT